MKHAVTTSPWIPFALPTRGKTEAWAGRYQRQQRLRLLAFLGHQTALRALTRWHTAAGAPSEARPKPAQLRAVQQRYQRLLERDQAHVRAGAYPAEMLFTAPNPALWRLTPALAREAWRNLGRRARGGYRELDAALQPENYPAYYRRNFHWQSGGYLTAESAELYDWSVELLFVGMADAMRRQVLPSIAATHRQQRQQSHRAPLSVLDVGCGTGRTLGMMRRLWPDAQLYGIDLSPAYIAYAAQALHGPPVAPRLSKPRPPQAYARGAPEAELPAGRDVELRVGSAESLPYPAESFDVVTSTFVMHELPGRVRQQVLRECARVLRPGGSLVLLDAAQAHDGADILDLLRAFPARFHEPFFDRYLDDALEDVCQTVGLRPAPAEDVYVAKLLCAFKSGAHSRSRSH
ncbi:MAG: methyltransferase domain-containing protein [Polyangiales bacterium]